MRTTIDDIRARYVAGERFAMVTAYDAASARLVEKAEVPLVLVGDSLGMTMLGYDSTLPVTLEDVLLHTRSVMRGCATPLVVADLPFLTYPTQRDALLAAGRLMAEGGAQSVKLEGGAHVAPTVRALVEHGIPVMGHLGLTPQSVHAIGLRVQARSADAARRLVDDALALQEAGAWGVVLEVVPQEVAAEVTKRLDIPTIGIGAGPHTSGEVQVWHDVLGLDTGWIPRHATRFATLGEQAVAGLVAYREAVAAGTFPTSKNSAKMPPEDLAAALEALDAAGGASGPVGPVGGAGRP